METHLSTHKKRKFFKILVSMGILLLLVRLALPYIILRYAEYRLNKTSAYQVTIADLDLHLYKGSYVIKNIQLKKRNQSIPVPFFAAKTVELAVEWPALLTGHFVAQIDIYDPSLNFLVDPAGRTEQTSISAGWQNTVTALFPLNFNRITIHNGQVHLRNFTRQPTYDVYFKNINAQVDNLCNVRKTQQLLTSSLQVNAKTMDGANFNLHVAFNPVAQQPTFDLDAELQRMQISAINNLLRYYTKIDIQQGLFSLYVEAAAKNGKITGYAKPLIENLKVMAPHKKTAPITKLYKSAVQAVAKILENPAKKTVATKINFTGKLDDPNISIWPIISNLLKNAFLTALLPQIDNTIKMQDINLNN